MITQHRLLTRDYQSKQPEKTYPDDRVNPGRGLAPPSLILTIAFMDDATLFYFSMTQYQQMKVHLMDLVAMNGIERALIDRSCIFQGFSAWLTKRRCERDLRAASRHVGP